MVKIFYTIILILLFPAFTYATEICPPGYALSHLGGSGAPWILDPTYKKQGWYVSQSPWANRVKATTLRVGDLAWVDIMIDKKTKYGYVKCRYYNVNSFGRVTVANNKPFEIHLNDNSYFRRNLFGEKYTCATANNTIGQCWW